MLARTRGDPPADTAFHWLRVRRGQQAAASAHSGNGAYFFAAGAAFAFEAFFFFAIARRVCEDGRWAGASSCMARVPPIQRVR